MNELLKKELVLILNEGHTEVGDIIKLIKNKFPGLMEQMIRSNMIEAWFWVGVSIIVGGILVIPSFINRKRDDQFYVMFLAVSLISIVIFAVFFIDLIQLKYAPDIFVIKKILSMLKS